MDSECIHGLDRQWCAACLDAERASVLRTEPKPVVKVRKAKPKPSVFDMDTFKRQVQRYTSGAWCDKCRTPRERGYCQCDRLERFELHKDVIKEWADQAYAHDPKKNKNAKFYAIGAISRELTRAGIGDQRTELPGISRRQAEMVEIRQHVEMPLEWSPSRNTTADPFPMPL